MDTPSSAPEEAANNPAPKLNAHIWSGHILLARSGMNIEINRHYLAVVILALDEPIRIETEQKTLTCQAACIKSNTSHKTFGAHTRVVVMLTDPEAFEYESILSPPGAAQIQELDHNLFLPLKPQIQKLFDGAACAEALSLYQSIFETAYQPFPNRQMKNRDERVVKIAEKLKTELPDSIRVEELAQEVSISGDRLMRLFKEQMGLPVRRYLLWLRLLESIRLIRQGSSFTDAAHAAGFSDAAHMSRVFKEILGFNPSFYFGKTDFLKLNFCEDF